MNKLQTIIHSAWNNREHLTKDTDLYMTVQQAVQQTLDALDKGELRIAEKKEGQWITHAWLKQAVLLSFRLSENKIFEHGPLMRESVSDEEDQPYHWYDKVPLKCAGWDKERFQHEKFRMVPGAIVRHSAYIGPDVVLMPSFINVGAYVGGDTMIDTWSTIGSCAQIGKRCHISGGVGIGGVLEPLQANPVIIEDNCFIGARSEIAEGVLVEEGAVISMGVFLGASTKIVDRASGEIHYGRIPAYSVVVPGTYPGKDGAPHLACAVIVKTVDEKTREKTAINELLRF